MTPYPAIWLLIWAKMITIIMAINQKKMFFATNILLTKSAEKFFGGESSRPEREKHKATKAKGLFALSFTSALSFTVDGTNVGIFSEASCLHFFGEGMLIIAFTEPTSGRPGAPLLSSPLLRLCDVTAAPFDADEKLLLRDASVAPAPNWE